MISFKHILCPVDFSETSAHALLYATALATWYESRLSVLHVVPTFDTVVEPAMRLDQPGRMAYPAARDEVLATMRAWIERAGATALDPELLADEGHPPDVIAARAAALRVDLTVLGTHGRRGFRRLLLGSVTEQVLREASCPVLTVPPAPSARPAPVVFRRILCPIDFSPSSLKALQVALELGAYTRGCVTVLHAIEYMDEEEPCEHVDFDIRNYRRHLVGHLREKLHDQLAGTPHQPCDVEEVVVVSRAYREILRRAASVDLIVMGAQGHAGIDLMLHGSNTQHTVRAAPCPVLTVRA